MGGLTLGGCPGELENPERFGDGGTLACFDVVTELFPQRCDGTGCHRPGEDQVDLLSGGVEARLTNAPSEQCAGKILADPADPEGSVLYVKLASAMPCGGVQMPLGGEKLTSDELACVASWIGELSGGPGPGSGGMGGMAGAGGRGSGGVGGGGGTGG